MAHKLLRLPLQKQHWLPQTPWPWLCALAALGCHCTLSPCVLAFTSALSLQIPESEDRSPIGVGILPKKEGKRFLARSHNFKPRQQHCRSCFVHLCLQGSMHVAPQCAEFLSRQNSNVNTLKGAILPCVDVSCRLYHYPNFCVLQEVFLLKALFMAPPVWDAELQWAYLQPRCSTA